MATERRSTLLPRIAALAIGILIPQSRASANDGNVQAEWGHFGTFGPMDDRTVTAAAYLPSLDVSFTADFTAVQPLSFYTTTTDGKASYECGDQVALVDDFVGRALLLDERGQLLLAGGGLLDPVTGVTGERAVVMRLQPDYFCIIDESWSATGYEIFDDAPYCDNEECRILGLAEGPGNRLFALIESEVNAFVSKYAVVGFEADGDVDTSFGTSGFAEVVPGELGTLLAARGFLGVDSKNRIYVLVARLDPDELPDTDPLLARFESDGDPDPTFFGTGMLLVLDESTYRHAPTALALDGDLVGLAYADSAAGADSQVGIFDFDGGVDTGLSFAGRVSALAFQGDHKLLLAIESPVFDEASIGRFLVDLPNVPSFDPTFHSNDYFPLDVDGGGSDADTVVAIVPAPGAIAILGNGASDESPSGAFEFRLQNSLLFADGFEGGKKSAWAPP